MKLSGATLLVAVSLSSLTFAMGCSDNSPTAITVAISSEAKVPKGVSHVDLIVKRNGQEKLNYRYDVQADQTVQLPGTLTIVNDEDSDPADPVTVSIEAALMTGTGDTKKVIRSATLGFSENKQKVLRMPIRFSCADFTCPEGLTCKAGQCLSPTVDVNTLEDYVEHEVLPQEGMCFSKKTCLDSGGEMAQLAIEDIVDNLRDDCTLPYLLFESDADLAEIKDPDHPSLQAVRNNVNMGFIWSSAFDIDNQDSNETTQSWTVVDLDEDEGWEFADRYKTKKNADLEGDDLAQRVALTPGLCAALKNDKAAISKARAELKPGQSYARPPTALLGAQEIRGCAPKTPSMPECVGSQQGTTGKLPAPTQDCFCDYSLAASTQISHKKVVDGEP